MIVSVRAGEHKNIVKINSKEIIVWGEVGSTVGSLAARHAAAGRPEIAGKVKKYEDFQIFWQK